MSARQVWRRVRRIPEALLLGLFWLAVPVLPRPFVLALARGAGRLALRLDRRGSRVARANVELAFGDSLTAERKEAIVQGAYQTFARVFFDLFWFSWFTRHRLRRYVRFDPSFDEYFAHPAGQMGLTAHFGNWELLGLAVALRGRPSVSVATPQENRVADALLWWIRGRTGQRIVPREGALREMMKALKANQDIGVLLDQNTLPDEGGEFVEFFGLPVPMSRAVASLGLKTGSDIKPAFCAARPDGTYLAYTLPRVTAAELKREPGQATQRVARLLEVEIRRCPEQWLWMYKRWKFIPAGAARERYPYYARDYQGRTTA